jgi:hypothetical protein
MSLAIYTLPDPDYRLFQVSDTVFSPGLSVSFDGRVGGAQVKKLYIRNDNNDTYYTNTTIQALDSGAPSRVDGTNWHWKLAESDLPPSEYSWAEITPGNQLLLSSSIGTSRYGETAAYFTFWLRIQTPPRQLVQNIKSIVLRITATERLVGA